MPIRLAKTCSMAVGSPQAAGRSPTSTVASRSSIVPRSAATTRATIGVDLDRLPAILDLAGPGEPEQGVDDPAEPGDGRLDEADRLGHVGVDQGPGLPADLGRDLVACRRAWTRSLPISPEFLAEPLQVDQRRAEVVRDAVDEHLVLLRLLAELGVDDVEFLGPAFEELGVVLLPPGRPRRGSAAISWKTWSSRAISSPPAIGGVSSLPSASRWAFSVRLAIRPLMFRAKRIARSAR